MFSAIFLVKYADGASESSKQEAYKELDLLASAVSKVYVMGVVPDPDKAQPGDPLYGLKGAGYAVLKQSPVDLFLELGFPSQDAYEAAKATASWPALKAALQNHDVYARYEFAASGDGPLRLTDTERSRCHRVFFASLYDDADPAKVAHTELAALHFQDNIKGFNNSKFSKVVESEGSYRWDYVFECDYEDLSVYIGPYILHPVHLCYFDKFFDPMCKECTFKMFQPEVPVLCDRPFLANYAS